MEIDFLNDFNDIIIDARINSNDGVELFHSMTLYDNDLIKVSKGVLQTKVNIENKLQPGIRTTLDRRKCSPIDP